VLFLTPNTLVVVDQSLPPTEVIRLWSLSNMGSNIMKVFIDEQKYIKVANADGLDMNVVFVSESGNLLLPTQNRSFAFVY